MEFKILVANGNEGWTSLIKDYITKRDNKDIYVSIAEDGNVAERAFAKEKYDIIILDVDLNGKDGLTLCKEFKQLRKDVSILFLTRNDLQENKIAAFENGAEDYVTIPCSMIELGYRLDCILRRLDDSEVTIKEVYQIGKFTFNTKARTLALENDLTSLSTKQNEILSYLALNLNCMVERSFLLKKIWGNDTQCASRSLDVYLTNLRKLFKRDEHVKLLSVHGQGFKLIVE